MLTKEKMFVVLYLDVRKIDENDINRVVCDISHNMKQGFDNSVIHFVIPIYDDSRIECLNPVLLNEDQYEDVKRKLERIDEEYFKTLNEEENGETTE